jgi:hypothetical protein
MRATPEMEAASRAWRSCRRSPVSRRFQARALGGAHGPLASLGMRSGCDARCPWRAGTRSGDAAAVVAGIEMKPDPDRSEERPAEAHMSRDAARRNEQLIEEGRNCPVPKQEPFFWNREPFGTWNRKQLT